MGSGLLRMKQPSPYRLYTRLAAFAFLLYQLYVYNRASPKRYALMFDAGTTLPARTALDFDAALARSRSLSLALFPRFAFCPCLPS